MEPAWLSEPLVRKALSVNHRIGKDAFWIRGMASRIERAAGDTHPIARDARMVRELADEIVRSTRALSAEIARVDGIAADTAPLVELIQIAVEQATRREHTQRVRIEVASQLERVMVDKGLEEILVEVLENALDDSVGSQVVELTATEREGRILITVSDDGSGMSAEQLERCAELGFTTKADRSGSGIGIPLARAALRSVGGSLQISSRSGEGTRIEIEVPIGDGQQSWECAPPLHR